MTPAEHAAEAERQLGYVEESGDELEIQERPALILLSALGHAVLAIAYELGVPPPVGGTPEAATPGNQVTPPTVT